MPNHVPPPEARCAHKAYGLDCEDYDQLVEHAGGVCQICTIEPAKTGHGFLVVDHDAARGCWAVRGLLCSDCNTQIPAGSSPSWARRYLADPWWRVAKLDERQSQIAEDEAATAVFIAAVASATAEYEAARAEVVQAIFDAYRDPAVKRTEIAEASPWTAAHVRKLARDEGIEPDPAYAKRTAARQATDQA